MFKNSGSSVPFTRTVLSLKEQFPPNRDSSAICRITPPATRIVLSASGLVPPTIGTFSPAQRTVILLEYKINKYIYIYIIYIYTYAYI